MISSKLWKRKLIKLITGNSLQSHPQIASQLSLAETIAAIDWLFGCDRILQEFNVDTTIPYYTQSEWGYRLYHSGQDAIHMALNPDGVFNAEGYYAQPRIVGAQIEQISAQNVLEVGCGKGFNSKFLASQYPTVQFTGIDLTPLHIKIARRQAQVLSNLNFQIGNFNQLTYIDQSFDIVFAFECLCHAPQAKIPLTEIFRVLRPGGRLIVFDGYRRTKISQMPELIQTAAHLTEISLAVNYGFAEIDHWLAIAESIGYKIREVTDCSAAIQPNLRKLQNLSWRFFNLAWKAKLLAYFLPKYFIRNAIAGLLMPLTTHPEQGVFSYYQIILERP